MNAETLELEDEQHAGPADGGIGCGRIMQRMHSVHAFGVCPCALLPACRFSQDGYEVLVDEVDVEAAKEAASAGAAAAAAVHEERLVTQMRTAARLQEEAGRAMGAQAKQQ